MENQKSFDDLYDQDLIPEIEKQEGARKAFKKKFLTYLIISFTAFISIYLLVVNTFLLLNRQLLSFGFYSLLS